MDTATSKSLGMDIATSKSPGVDTATPRSCTSDFTPKSKKRGKPPWKNPRFCTSVFREFEQPWRKTPKVPFSYDLVPKARKIIKSYLRELFQSWLAGVFLFHK